MKKRTVAAIAATTLGLTLVGAGAASAANGAAPVEWAQQMAQHAGLGYGPGPGDGSGDPTTCPNYDGTAEQVQERTRERLQDRTADKDMVQQQLRDRDRVHVTS